MTRRKSTLEEAREFIQDNLYPLELHIAHVKIILEEVLPFSWAKYCKMRGQSEEIKEEKAK